MPCCFLPPACPLACRLPALPACLLAGFSPVGPSVRRLLPCALSALRLVALLPACSPVCLLACVLVCLLACPRALACLLPCLCACSSFCPPVACPSACLPPPCLFVWPPVCSSVLALLLRSVGLARCSAGSVGCCPAVALCLPLGGAGLAGSPGGWLGLGFRLGSGWSGAGPVRSLQQLVFRTASLADRRVPFFRYDLYCYERKESFP